MERDMFLDPRYARVSAKKNGPKAVGVGDLFLTLPDVLFCGGDHPFSGLAEHALGVSILRLKCKLMQTAPLRCKQ